MRIAFIGLGNMGAPMALNLVKAGHDVVGVDPVARPNGITMGASVSQACGDADIAITMLPNGEILRQVAPDVIASLPSGGVFLDCSTVDVASAKAVADDATNSGVGALDAPVSGGIKGASDGTLTFMVGGDQTAFETTKPLFEIMGQRAVFCGAAGAGQTAKICNNMILGITMLGTCEAFALADKLGLDRRALFEVVSTSSGYSWSMNAYCPAPDVGPQSPADNGYEPGFAAELMLKDLRLSQEAAAGADASTQMGALAQSLYATFVEHEGGEGKDFSGVLPWLAAKGHS